jgi:hypothetical protein
VEKVSVLHDTDNIEENSENPSWCEKEKDDEQQICVTLTVQNYVSKLAHDVWWKKFWFMKGKTDQYVIGR